ETAVLAQNGPADFESLSRQAAAALQSNPTEAIGLYRKALASQPSWAEGWFYLAASLYQTGAYPESREAFQQAAKLAPDNGTVWAFLGFCEYQTGDFAGALADIKKGESLGLGDNRAFISTVRNRAALIHLRSSDYGAAMEQLGPLARLGDDSDTTINALGVGALGLPYLPTDVPAQDKGLVHLAGQAAWAMAAQRADDTAKLSKQLVERYPKQPGVHYLYGIYLLSDHPDEALIQFQKELQVRPSHVPARLQIATLKLKSGDPQEAIGMAKQALEIQPNNPFCYIALGRALLGKGQVQEAVPELEAAAKIAPQDPQPHFYQEQAYRRLSRTADALKEKEQFARLKAAQDPLVLPNFNQASMSNQQSTGSAHQ
ncbi:MAG: tetratricopeptide repeat protein, partial [Acidobacteriaceae bacterium]|nr:tetratricopeptide repeat protein [Acidobacteriaceae bacterium]